MISGGYAGTQKILWPLRGAVDEACGSKQHRERRSGETGTQDERMCQSEPCRAPSAPYPAEGPGVEAQGGLKSGMGMSGSGGVVLPLWGRSAESSLQSQEVS